MLKKNLFFISVLYTLALAVVCLISLKNVPDVGLAYADKIFHCLTYFIFTLLWFGSFVLRFGYPKVKALLFSAFFAIIFGIIVEVLQGKVTTTRTLDFYDVIANTLGVVLAVVILMLNIRKPIKK